MEKFTSSNSANAMSKSIGQQIDKLIEHQSKLEKDFDNLIQQKTKLIDLVDNYDINILILKIKGNKVSICCLHISLKRRYRVSHTGCDCSDDLKLLKSNKFIGVSVFTFCLTLVDI